MSQDHQVLKDVDEFLAGVERNRSDRMQKSATRQAKTAMADQAHASAEAEIDQEISHLVGSLDSATLGYLATLTHS